MNCVLLSGYYICYIGVITAGLAVMAVTNADSEWEINAFAISFMSIKSYKDV